MLTVEADRTEGSSPLCGRYNRKTPLRHLATLFDCPPPPDDAPPRYNIAPPRYNIAPTQAVH